MSRFLSALGIFLLFASAHASEITVQVDQPIRRIERSQLLGQNIALWYSPSLLQNETTFKYLRDAGIGGIRIPGGSWGDKHFWNGNGVRNGNQIDASKYHDYQWDIDYSNWAPGFNASFIPNKPNTPQVPGQVPLSVKDLHEFIRKLGCTTMVIVNAGSGNAKMAAEWVRWANKKQGYDVPYWEVGNELEGSWEVGSTRPDGSRMTGKKYADIFSAFAREMRKIDPEIKIGGPSSGHPFMREFLENTKERIDFLSYHVYARNRSKTLHEWARSAQDIFGTALSLRKDLESYRTQRAKEIEIHLTEYNIWPQGLPTVFMDCGIWTAVSLGELLKSEVDHCWFWDTFTVNGTTGQGHGFLFPTPEGIVRKSQYWAFYIFHHYFGNQILKVETDADDLFAYAAKGESNQLFVVVVNGSDAPVQSTIRLKGKEAITNQVIRSATFSATEYKWNLSANRPWWSTPPRERQLATQQIKNYIFPPASITAFIYSAPAQLPALLLEGQNKIFLPKNIKSTLRILVLDEQGQPAADVPVAIRTKRKAAIPTHKQVKTDGNGVAEIELSAAKRISQGQVLIAAKLPSGKITQIECPLQVVVPQLEIICPDASEAGKSIPILLLLHAGTNDCGGRITLDYPGSVSLRTSGTQKTLPFHQGMAITTWDLPHTPGKMNLLASIPRYHISSRHPIELYKEKEKEECMLTFEEKKDLQAIPKTMRDRFVIDETIRPNQGVLAYQLSSDENRFSFALNSMPNQDRFKEIQDKITGFSIDVHIPRRSKIPSNAVIRWKITSAANKWSTVTSLQNIRAGKWTTLQIKIPENRLEEFSQIHTLELSIEGVGDLQTIHFDNLTLFFKDR